MAIRVLLYLINRLNYGLKYLFRGNFMEKKKNEGKGKRSRKKIIAVIFVIAIAGLSVVGFRYKRVFKEKEQFVVQKGIVEEELILTGEISADEYASLFYPVSGKIVWVGVSEGDWIKKGQALGKIDTTSLNANYQRALADLRSAEATLERVYDAIKDNDDSESYSFKETRTAAEVAKDKAWEAVLMAEDNLRNATLYSPFEGVITHVASPFSGINISLTQPQFSIFNPETVYFEVFADQSEVTRIFKGQKVAVVLDSFFEEELQGEVVFIGFAPISREAGAVYKVKVEMSKEGFDTEKLRIGMTGDAKFIVSKSEDALWVPSNFINYDDEGIYINVGRENNKVYIKTGIEGEERTEIKGSVKEGDIVFY